MVTSSCVIGLVHAPLFTCQRKTFAPKARPLTAVVDAVGLAMVPLPLTRVQVPTAGTINTLPWSVVLVVGVHNSWSAPAAATGLFGS